MDVDVDVDGCRCRCRWYDMIWDIFISANTHYYRW